MNWTDKEAFGVYGYSVDKKCLDSRLRGNDIWEKQMAIKWKLKAGRTWREKLEKDQPPKVVKVPSKMQKRFGTGTMLVPRPLDVDELIRKIPKGKLATTTQIGERLAKDCKADCACPMTTGIFIKIAAETAEEDLRNGKKKITPYWRVVKSDGSLNEKFPGGTSAQARRLRAEGHAISTGKTKSKVKEFKKALVKF